MSDVYVGDHVLFNNEYRQPKIGIVTDVRVFINLYGDHRDILGCVIEKVNNNPQHQLYHRPLYEVEVITHLTAEEKLTHHSEVVRKLPFSPQVTYE